MDKLKAQSPAKDALIKQLEEIAPAEMPTDPAAPPTLGGIGAQMVAAVMGMQAAEMPPTALELQACSRQQVAYAALMTKWTALRAAAK